MADRSVKLVRKNGKKPVGARKAKAANQLFDKNSLVEFVSGLLNPSDADDTIVYGIIKEEVAAGDSDYSSETLKQIEVIDAGDEIEIDVTATLTVGTSYGIDNAYTVDQSDTSNDVFTCTESLSSSRAIGYFKSVSGGNTT